MSTHSPVCYWNLLRGYYLSVWISTVWFAWSLKIFAFNCFLLKFHKPCGCLVLRIHGSLINYLIIWLLLFQYRFKLHDTLCSTISSFNIISILSGSLGRNLIYFHRIFWKYFGYQLLQCASDFAFHSFSILEWAPH